MITHIIKKTGEAIVILLTVFFLGLLIPMLITTLCVIFVADATYAEAMNSVPFWLFTIVGWVIAGCYINEQVNKL
jgi:hypothetical protein